MIIDPIKDEVSVSLTAKMKPATTLKVSNGRLKLRNWEAHLEGSYALDGTGFTIPSMSMSVSGEIEIAPLAFMRGRTLSSSYVIIDEAQNTTPVQMKMVLTRLGQDSRMVITGDLSQIDLPDGHPSGLADAEQRLDDVEGIGIIHLSGKDVVRHPVVARILAAYESGS